MGVCCPEGPAPFLAVVGVSISMSGEPSEQSVAHCC